MECPNCAKSNPPQSPRCGRCECELVELEKIAGRARRLLFSAVEALADGDLVTARRLAGCSARLQTTSAGRELLELMNSDPALLPGEI